MSHPPATASERLPAALSDAAQTKIDPDPAEAPSPLPPLKNRACRHAQNPIRAFGAIAPS